MPPPDPPLPPVAPPPVELAVDVVLGPPPALEVVTVLASLVPVVLLAEASSPPEPLEVPPLPPEFASESPDWPSELKLDPPHAHTVKTADRDQIQAEWFMA